jgi:transcription elongation GreA/GreB family factor
MTGTADRSDRRGRLRTELVARLRDDLANAEKAHRATLEGVTHEEAKPENDKDTRALEQSYLARGQAVRVEELKDGIARVEAMQAPRASAEARTMLGSLVTVSEGAYTTTYWIAAYGGGCELATGVHVVTPRSPLGQALVGKVAGDEVEVIIGGRTRTLEIDSVE